MRSRPSLPRSVGLTAVAPFAFDGGVAPTGLEGLSPEEALPPNADPVGSVVGVGWGCASQLSEALWPRTLSFEGVARRAPQRRADDGPRAADPHRRVRIPLLRSTRRQVDLGLRRSRPPSVGGSSRRLRGVVGGASRGLRRADFHRCAQARAASPKRPKKRARNMSGSFRCRLRGRVCTFVRAVRTRTRSPALQPLLTTNEIGKMVGVSERTVANWIDRGYLQAFRTPGRPPSRRREGVGGVPPPTRDAAVPTGLDHRPSILLVVEDDQQVASSPAGPTSTATDQMGRHGEARRDQRPPPHRQARAAGRAARCQHAGD
jgi:hypothetical protein